MVKDILMLWKHDINLVTLTPLAWNVSNSLMFRLKVIASAKIYDLDLKFYGRDEVDEKRTLLSFHKKSP